MGSTHSVGIGYILWLFGFLGAHRFYFGKPITGLIWFFTAGLCGIGWVIDAFLMSSLDRDAYLEFSEGRLDYTTIWVLLTFLGVFGAHRFAMGKWITGLVYIFTFGLFGLGYIYDLCTLNSQIDEINLQG